MSVVRQKQTVTLKDIAAKTGYSINTVSRALRGKDDIAPQTRDKIKQAAQEMGHIGNMLASSLRLGYTKTIAVILGDVSNPNFAIMMKEIETRAREKGYSSFLLNTNEDELLEYQAIQMAMNKNVDGIILCPTQKSTRNVEYLQSTGVPFVLIGRHFQSLDTDYVVCNDELGGYQATSYLLSRGHKRVLMLHGPSYISSASERLSGYIHAHKEAGVPLDAKLVCEVPVMADGCQRVLERLEKEAVYYSAVFAFSDMVAWNVWSYLQNKGVAIPRQCSLIGFDHIQSRLMLPFCLTSISSHQGQMSVEAVDLLLDRIRGEAAESRIVIDTELAEGDTVARPQ